MSDVPAVVENEYAERLAPEVGTIMFRCFDTFLAVVPRSGPGWTDRVRKRTRTRTNGVRTGNGL